MQQLHVITHAFGDELTKIAADAHAHGATTRAQSQKIAGVVDALRNPSIREHATELAGLGVLAVPGLDTLQARARARLAGDASPQGAKSRRLLGETGHAVADVGGLGILMGPELAKLRHR